MKTIFIFVLIAFSSATAVAEGFVRLAVPGNRHDFFVYTPNNWNLDAFDSPVAVVENPPLKKLAVFETDQTGVRGEIRILEKRGYDAAAVFVATAKKTLGADVTGADKIVGNQDVGVFRIKYKDRDENIYIEQIITNNRIAVSLLFKISKKSGKDENIYVKSVLDKSYLTLDLQ